MPCVYKMMVLVLTQNTMLFLILTQNISHNSPNGVSQGPFLFSLHTTPLCFVIDRHKGIKFQFYADNTQVNVHLPQKNSSAAFEQLKRCLDDVKEWMSASKLKLNPDIRLSLLLFGSKRQRNKLKAYFLTTVFGSPHLPAKSVKNLGVWFDSF